MRDDLKPLLDAYCGTLAMVRRIKRSAPKHDKVILADMESDIAWTIEYMASGYPPAEQNR